MAGEVPVLERPWEPAWLAAARRRAATWATTHGFPTTKHEDWRSTRIDAALAVPMTVTSEEPGVGESPSASAIAVPVPHLGGPQVVVVNGRVVARSSVGGARRAGGVRVASLADALPGYRPLLQRWWAPTDEGHPHALRALNAAAAPDVVVIDVPTGVLLDDPIEVVLVSGPGDEPDDRGRWWHPRLIVRVGAGARVGLVETYLSEAGAPTVTNARTQVELGPGAELEHTVLQGEHTDGCHFSTVEAHLAERSRLATRLLATGARIGRHEVDLVLAGQGSRVDVDGLFLTGPGQLHDNPVWVDHVAGDGTSRQLYLGVVSGDGHGVFNGHIVVRPGVDGTDAAQVNRNLLLSDRAEVDTRPRLEISADDVACTHGAAVGQLDADALFYLRARGIEEHDARAILVSGFAAAVLDRFPSGPIRRHAWQMAAATGVATLGDGADRPFVHDADRLPACGTDGLSAHSADGSPVCGGGAEASATVPSEGRP